MRFLNYVVLLACLPMSALADELADAQKLWENKQFTAAFSAFTRLATAGNAGAQLQLGEMYGFGEGTAEDLAQARHWLDKAARAGHPEATSSLALVNQRAARKNDIAYYIGKFDGGGARFENFQCKQPALPQYSSDRNEIKAVNESITQWRSCYETFANNLERVAAPAKTIPADVISLMNNDEYQQASRHIGKIYTDIGNAAAKEGEDFYKNINDWMTRTAEFLEKSREGNDPTTQRLVSENASFVRNHNEAFKRGAEAQGRRK